MGVEFKINEGELITIYYRKQKDTNFSDFIGGLIVWLVGGPLFSIILTSILSVIFKFFIEKEIVDNYVGKVTVILALLIYLMAFIVWVIDINTEPSIEIYYFNNYLLLNNIPDLNPKNLKPFEPIKLSYDHIDYFILVGRRIKIHLKENQNESFENLNNDHPYGSFKILSHIMNIRYSLLNKKLRLNKTEVINFLNSKLDSK